MKWIWIPAAIVMLLLFPLTAHADAEQGCSTALLEAQSGMLLQGNDPERILPVGSQAKLMTVYLAADAVAAGRLAIAESVTISPAAEGAPGATIWLQTGEQMTAGDLLKAVFIGNANDACIALACRLSGS